MQFNEQHKKAIDLAIKSAIHLQLHTDSVCTTCQYLHRFYLFIDKSNKNTAQSETRDYDIGIVVSTCLYIAIKTNENHIRLSDLISSVHYHLKTHDIINYNNYQPLEKDQEYWRLRETVLQFELFMLRVLKFNLTMDLPHKYLIFYLKNLSDWIHNDTLMEELFLLSWSLLNDYYCNHPESVKFQTNHSALASIELAITVISPNVKNLIEDKQKPKIWYTNFDKTLKQEVIKEIIEQILTVCTNSKALSIRKQ